MNTTTNINQSLSDTIKNSDLQSVAAGITETFIDSFLENGVLKDLPIVGTLIGLGKTAADIKNQLFLKKVLRFLFELRDIPAATRKNMIDKVDNNPDYRINVGEQLTYILDKCNDHLHAEYIAQLFHAYLIEKITYSEFLKSGAIIQNIFIEDLEKFLLTEEGKLNFEASPDEAPTEDDFPLINIGILGLGYNPIRVEDQWDHEMSGKYIVAGGEAVIWITSIGRILKSNLKVSKKI
jgi:hypothetical protein